MATHRSGENAAPGRQVGEKAPAAAGTLDSLWPLPTATEPKKKHTVSIPMRIGTPRYLRCIMHLICISLTTQSMTILDNTNTHGTHHTAPLSAGGRRTRASCSDKTKSTHPHTMSHKQCDMQGNPKTYKRPTDAASLEYSGSEEGNEGSHTGMSEVAEMLGLDPGMEADTLQTVEEISAEVDALLEADETAEKAKSAEAVQEVARKETAEREGLAASAPAIAAPAREEERLAREAANRLEREMQVETVRQAAADVASEVMSIETFKEEHGTLEGYIMIYQHMEEGMSMKTAPELDELEVLGAMAKELTSIPGMPILPTEGWAKGGKKGPYYFYIGYAEARFITAHSTYIYVEYEKDGAPAHAKLVLKARAIAEAQPVPSAPARQGGPPASSIWLDVFLGPGYEFTHVDKNDLAAVLCE